MTPKCDGVHYEWAGKMRCQTWGSACADLAVQTPAVKCDPAPDDSKWVPPSKTPSTGWDPEWGMYVTPDDPLRDTPEKAQRYYTNLFEQFGIMEKFAAVHPDQLAKASPDDLEAAAALLQ